MCNEDCSQSGLVIPWILTIALVSEEPKSKGIDQTTRHVPVAACCLVAAASCPPRLSCTMNHKGMNHKGMNHKGMPQPGPRKYVKQQPKASWNSPKGHSFTYFWGPGRNGWADDSFFRRGTSKMPKSGKQPDTRTTRSKPKSLFPLVALLLVLILL